MIKLKEDKLPKILKECFIYYSYQINNIRKGAKYKFNYTENTSLYNFVNILQKEFPQYKTIDWLFDYFNFQFNLWDFIKASNEAKTGKSYKIMLHWMLGKKGLNRFLKKDSKDEYFYHSSFLPKYNIRKKDLINHLDNLDLLVIENKISNSKDVVMVINPLIDREEREKKKYFNTTRGFYNCLQETTLFKFISPSCKKCKFKSSCRKVLRREYPTLYQKRFANKIMLKSNKK